MGISLRPGGKETAGARAAPGDEGRKTTPPWRWGYPLFGALCLAWLLLRSGRKPSRMRYPCQQAAAVHSTWDQRGMTNTDVVRGLITAILEHPDGFTGEVVLVENCEGGPDYDHVYNNAENPAQSFRAVVDSYGDPGRVSASSWWSFTDDAVYEFDSGDGPGRPRLLRGQIRSLPHKRLRAARSGNAFQRGDQPLPRWFAQHRVRV